MTDNENKITQIAFSFEEVKPALAREISADPVTTTSENVNVGVRIKAFKEITANTSTPASANNIRTKSTRGRKPLKSIEEGAYLISIPIDELLFQRQYYSIGEVAAMFSVNTSLIRFWANEFDNLIQPRKNRKGDRHFRPIDIKNMLLVHDLLRIRKLTIEGAKDFLKNNKKAQERFEMIESMRKIKNFFLEIKSSL